MHLVDAALGARVVLHRDLGNFAASLRHQPQFKRHRLTDIGFDLLRRRRGGAGGVDAGFLERCQNRFGSLRTQLGQGIGGQRLVLVQALLQLVVEGTGIGHLRFALDYLADALPERQFRLGAPAARPPWQVTGSSKWDKAIAPAKLGGALENSPMDYASVFVAPPCQGQPSYFV